MQLPPAAAAAADDVKLKTECKTQHKLCKIAATVAYVYAAVFYVI